MVKEDATLASLFLTLKGAKKKREDWISIAKRCQAIIDGSKSTKEAAKKAGASSQLIRSIASLLKLPVEVQSLIKEGKILMDAAQRLNTIEGSKRQLEVAKAIVGLTSHQQREIIQYAKKFPNAKLSDYKNRVIKPREIEKLHVGIIPLREEVFEAIQKASKKKDISIEKLLVDIVENWLERENR